MTLLAMLWVKRLILHKDIEFAFQLKTMLLKISQWHGHRALNFRVLSSMPFDVEYLKSMSK